ncbi:MAG: Xanthan lyase [Verrucomicrobiales bacterium]|nr:Xanthan lyase [Verrucomicrobiales bacterium]
MTSGCGWHRGISKPRLARIIPNYPMSMMSVPFLRQFCLGLILACSLGEVSAKEPAKIITADVCIYGGTSGGVIAAVQAARMGKQVIIVEPGQHLGGMTAGGLSAVDIGDPRTVGGITREYFTRLAGTVGRTLAWDKPFATKGGPATGGAFAIEPHQAEQLFKDFAREAKVTSYFSKRLSTLQKKGTRIVGFTTEDGTVFRAKMFIDATYEGDLMAKAGVSFTVMREGNANYGEKWNGIYYAKKYSPRTTHQKPGANGRTPDGQGVWDRDLPLDPYVVAGDRNSGLLPLVQAGEPGVPGAPAPGVQAYCYRLCLTTNANRLPITPPPNYDAKNYELVARFIAGCVALGDDMDLRWFSKYDALPNGKFDFNTATFGANLPGASWDWPEATYAEREKIAKEHENYHRGLLHFLATDSRVPLKVREEIKRFGLPRDEFTDNGGWPHQLYVREARRMVSDLVMTEHHTTGKETAPKPISLGSYGTDTHEIRRIVKDGVVTREGKTAEGRGFGPYGIGYGAVVPRAEQCENLFVTFALSASHTAFSSIRMEPVFMVTSQSAATAACVAIDDNMSVQQVNYPKLRARLIADGQKGIE